MQYVIKSTSELRTGDIVHAHGLRCLIDGEIKVSLTHASDDRRGEVRYTRALVLNRDEVSKDAVPYGFTSADPSRGDTPGEHRWTIQGNELARWHVEAEPSEEWQRRDDLITKALGIAPGETLKIDIEEGSA